MDRFVYNYHTIGSERSNRLNYVTDNGTDYSAYDDIKSGQATGNYTYNKIGELVSDASEDMELEWRTGDHKLLRVIRTDDASPNLTFMYNPFGQRIMKIATERANGNPTGQNICSFYSYDANGQVMAVYEMNWQANTYTLKERHLYGAERLGINATEVPIFENKAFTTYTHKEEDVVHLDIRGHKRYELTNHLGNVLAVINDRKVWNAADGNFEPVMLSWSDFYAGGMQMPGRNGGVNYRYLFNGMEHDGEVSGNGNSYTTEFRQYDPRLGRWKSLDPLMAQFPWMSPYVAFDNNPVYYTDPLGLAAEGGPGKGRGKTSSGVPKHKGGKEQNAKDKNSGFFKKWLISVVKSDRENLAKSGAIDGGLKNDVVVKPNHFEMLERFRAKYRNNEISFWQFRYLYNKYNWKEYDKWKWKANKLEHNKLKNSWEKGKQNAKKGTQLAIITSSSIVFAPYVLQAVVFSAPTVSGYVGSGLRFYHYTFGMRGGYQSFTLDFTLQSVLNPNANLNLYSLGSSFFIPGGLSLWKIGLWETSTTMIKADVKDGVTFRPYGYYGFSQNSSGFIMNSYGNSRFGTPFLGIYFQIYHNYLIGEFERKNSQQNEK